MCDSEDDLSSMSTVPYECDASDCSDSIYEKETQAIGELDNVEGIKGKSLKDNRCNSEIETVLYGGPTQPLKLKDLELRSNSLITTVGQSTSSETKQIVDSDCETIPESPFLNKDTLDDEIDFQKLKSRPASSASSLTDDDRTQLLPLVHQGNTFSSTTRQDCISPEIPLYEGPTQRLLIKSPITPNCISPEIPLYDGPTQRLLIKSHITPNSSQEDIACASKAEQSIDISDFDTLPMSPHYYPTEIPFPVDKRGSPEVECTRSKTPLYDGPTQPLPVRHNTKSIECTRSETPIYDGPTQPLPVRSTIKPNSAPKETCASLAGEKRQGFHIFTYITHMFIYLFCRI